MKNADKPAMSADQRFGRGWAASTGLTKREHFAGLAMQALITHHGNEVYVPCAAFAVEFANALLKALEVGDV